ncbi:hypothetical protein [Nocardiopsis sp. FR6]|uniref:hypothetical protein n=1 Tax=Nocardiopsis sp. FR6 TaxID=2605986 RepID=UPI00135A18B3|nr:hypothetical protein [Nocardiopsis sp. FR6]
MAMSTGCTAEEGDPASEPLNTPSSLAIPDSPSPKAEEAAVDAYLGMMRALVDASLEGAEDHADLEVYARGQALELTTDMLDGATATGEPVLNPEVAEARTDDDPPAVMIEDCMDNTDWVLEGEPARDPAERNTRLYTATVTLVEDQWMVEELWLGEPGAC